VRRVIILTHLLQKLKRTVKWINLAQDTDQWRAAVNILLNLRVPQNVEKFLTSRGNFSFPRTLLNGVSYLDSLHDHNDTLYKLHRDIERRKIWTQYPETAASTY
jgi:hypothetical protein